MRWSFTLTICKFTDKSLTIVLVSYLRVFLQTLLTLMFPNMYYTATKGIHTQTKWRLPSPPLTVRLSHPMRASSSIQLPLARTFWKQDPPDHTHIHSRVHGICHFNMTLIRKKSSTWKIELERRIACLTKWLHCKMTCTKILMKISNRLRSLNLRRINKQMNKVTW